MSYSPLKSKPLPIAMFSLENRQLTLKPEKAYQDNFRNAELIAAAYPWIPIPAITPVATPET